MYSPNVIQVKKIIKSHPDILLLIFGFLLICLLSYVIVPFIALSPRKSNSIPKKLQLVITAKGRNLYLHTTIFHSVGINRYNLLSRDTENGKVGCGNTFSEDEIDTMFARLHTIGITSVRFWLFQSFTKSGGDLSRFEYVLNVADRNGIKVIPVFENQWNDCSSGDIKSPTWYSSGYLYSYGAYPLSLKEYIGKIVAQYKNNPTIMLWQIMNEAEDSDVKGLYSFAKDVSGYIKSIDNNHLISIGTTGTKQTAREYRELYSLPTINVIDYHDYGENDVALPNLLSDRIQDSVILNKPIIVDESGIKKDVSERANLFQAKLQAFFKHGGTAYLIWSYGESEVVNDGYNFDIYDPLAPIVREGTINMHKKQ